MESPKEQQAEGSWNQFKGRLKESWGALTDDDIDRYEGRRDQLIGRIQEVTGKTRESIQDMVDSFSRDTKYRF